MTVEVLRGRVDTLRKQAGTRSGFVERESWNQFRVAPSCPPSKQLHLRGGRMYATYNPTLSDVDDYEYRAYTIPSLTADLGDVNSVTVDVTFVNPNFYQFFFLELCLPKVVEQPSASDWAFYLHGTLDEFATPGEAELWLDSYDFQRSSPWDHGWEDIVAYPLCGLVLKNDGTPGAGCPILPIDYMNRGRSYMWPTDMRPITSIYD